MQIGFYAIFDYTEYDTYGISIYFPDLPQCISCSKTEEEGFVMAKEALELETITNVAIIPADLKINEIEGIRSEGRKKEYSYIFSTMDMDLEHYSSTMKEQ